MLTIWYDSVDIMTTLSGCEVSKMRTPDRNDLKFGSLFILGSESQGSGLAISIGLMT